PGHDFQSRPCIGKVAHRARNRLAADLYRSGLQYAATRGDALAVHKHGLCLARAFPTVNGVVIFPCAARQLADWGTETMAGASKLTLDFLLRRATMMSRPGTELHIRREKPALATAIPSLHGRDRYDGRVHGLAAAQYNPGRRWYSRYETM